VSGGQMVLLSQFDHKSGVTLLILFYGY